MDFSIVPYKGWSRCGRLANDVMELIVSLEVGPRVLSFRRTGGENVFRNFEDMMGTTGGDEWKIYGGHRLWHAPEDEVRTYCPDNGDVEYTWDGHSLTLRAAKEERTGLVKTIILTPNPDGNTVKVLHRISNHTLWDVELAVWSLSVMDLHARAIIPQEPFVAHGDTFLPARPLVLWPFTDMSDPRWTWGKHYVQLQQMPEQEAPQKVGFLNQQGWAACTIGDELFIKKYAYDPSSQYTDMGVNTEVFTNGDILEVETLGPLERIAPGGSVDHVEQWGIFQIEVGMSEVSISENVLPMLKLVPNV